MNNQSANSENIFNLNTEELNLANTKIMTALLNKYSDMSQTQFGYNVEEDIWRQEEYYRIQELLQERRSLHALGLYELEEGEILE